MNDDTKAAYDEEVRLEGEVASKIQQIKLQALDLQKATNEDKVKNLQNTYDRINNQYKRDIDLEKAKGKDTFELEKAALKNKIFQNGQNRYFLTALILL